MDIKKQADFDYTWDIMVEYGFATNEELGLATALMGRHIGTLESVLYIRTGYRNLSQFFEEIE